jgi:hypothetical protein
MVHNDHLFILQFNASSFGSVWWKKCCHFFSVWCGIGRLSMGQGSRMFQSLILMDALSSAYWENKRKKKKKEK